MIQGDKKISCTAGISHVIMYPNADVYRCMAYRDANLPALFNAKEGWKRISELMECNSDRCLAWCDIDWTTKLISDGKNKQPKILRPLYTNFLDSEKLSAFAKQGIEKCNKKVIHIVWNPTLLCNYDCTYCECAVGKHDIFKELRSAYPELPALDWMKIWRGICDEYDFAVVDISGGEPLLSEATIPVIEMIAGKFLINLTTNLSQNITKIAKYLKPFITATPKEGFYSITASLHPAAKNFNKDLFFGSLLYLKNSGFKINVNFVAYPLQLFLAKEYKEWCNKGGIGFTACPWIGSDKDGFKPNYTTIEKKFLNGITPHFRTQDAQIQFTNYRYALKSNINDLEIEQGDCVTIAGSVKNTGEMKWSNKGLKEEDSFKVGLRIMRYGDERNTLKELRAPFPEYDIAPGESFDFKMAVDTSGMKEGLYLAKLDLLKERAFCFEDRGAEPARMRLIVLKSPFSSEVINVVLPTELLKNDNPVAKVNIRNTGDLEWPAPRKGDTIRVGCRIFKPKHDKSSDALKEFRAELPGVIEPNENFKVEMPLNFNGLPEGQYTLVFDMVNEKKFWFQDRGSQAYTLDMKVSK